MVPNAHAIWKKIAQAENCPQHQRINAVRALDEDCPFALLRRLIDSPLTPGRLRGISSEIFVRKMARRQLQKEENARKTEHRPNEFCPTESDETEG